VPSIGRANREGGTRELRWEITRRRRESGRGAINPHNL
jgi:hypothetical protein